MTTSWAYATRGQFFAALEAHVGGTLLALAAIMVSGSALFVAASGKWFARLPSEAVTLSAVMVAVGLLAGEWIVRMLSD